MLPRKHRLSKTADVNLTTAKGRSFFSPSFIIKSLHRPTDITALTTVIASTKVSKSAVVRNRLKRIIRQSIHEFISEFKVGSYVFILKKSATLVTTQVLREEVIQALKKSKILQS